MLVGAPPLSCGALQVISREVHVVSWIDTGRVQLVSDVAEPVISIKWLDGVAEHCGVETGEIVQVHASMLMVLTILVLLRELSHDVLHELAVQLELLHHSGHVIRRRRRIVATTTTTTGSNHPAKI